MNIPNESPLAARNQKAELTPNQIADLVESEKFRRQNDVALLLQQDKNLDDAIGIDPTKEPLLGKQALLEKGAHRRIIRKTEPLS